ncbi:hypothetical protein NHP190002_04400 [Helicobacter ailurogastricus]|uniref:DUF262 domain-containing protein n=1 Tax=Helicobacter ailurogastricus TaxID=1578720 RepID=UPI00244D8EE6|nr:DUF262 domain-containing protein [Helicobacter ailurogastricus]GMB89762.1 hypothetical protein NHP190002_04400 [Helicobacter ailurogastricus]
MKPMTFLDFLGCYAHIEVPMLQRDYAQGRRSQKYVADNFLDALFEVIEGRKYKLHLDLIYGYKDKEGGVFKLIDGQQRITTLWLLYFLLFRRAENLDAIKAQLAKFTYHTRESSKEFCEKLLKKSSSFATNKWPSETILQGGKFGEKEDLKNDPTIKAMICTLDRLYERLRYIKDTNCLKNTDCLKNRLDHITFSVIDMGEFGLGEELYIKLNARGKSLSPFENLKAFIEQKTSIPPELLSAIDNKWSDYFFDATQPETFDPRFFHFLHYANAFFKLDENTKKGIKTKIKDILDLNLIIDDKHYSPLKNKDNLDLLDRVMDALQSWGSFEDLEDLNPAFEGPDFFKNAIKEELTKKEVCYFFALLFVLEKHPKAQLDQNLQDYFRVVRHLVENESNIQDDDIPGLFNLLDFVSNVFSKDHKESGVYTFLAQQPEYPKRSYKLEARKAKLILKSRESKGLEDWEEALEETSEHAYLVGYVGFLLDFSKENGKENLQKFKNYADITIKILNTFFCDDTHDLGVLQRAWLCFGNYSTKKLEKQEKDNWFFCNRHQVGDFRYRNHVFELFAKEIKESSENYFFCNLLDRLLDTPQANLVEKMRSIVTDYTQQREQLIKRSWWEQCLLQDEKLFEYINAHQSKECGRIKIEEGGQVYLLRVKNKRSPYADLLGSAFYNYCHAKGLKGLGAYEGGQLGQRQFVVKDFAVIVEPKNIKLVNTIEEDTTEIDPIPLNLKNTDIFQEFEKAVGQIQKVIDRKRF